MTKILLLRHGEAMKKELDTILTEKGHKQAEALAKKLKEIPIDKVYVSDLTRAQETLKYYTKDNVITTPKLREIYRVIVGGKPKAGTPQEREEEDKKRADDVYQELLNQKGNIAVFAHGNIIRYFIMKTLGIQNSNLWDTLFIETCSISIIEKTENGIIRISGINIIDHLQDIQDFYRNESETIYH